MMSKMISAVEAYVAEVAKLAKTGTTTEHSFRPALDKLLKDLLPGFMPINEAKRIACGAPDFIVFNNNNLPVMFVETKDIGDSDLDGKKRTGNKAQFDRYKAALDTIVFTDFLDFHFYCHNGQLVGEVRIAEWDGSCLTVKRGNYQKFFDMMADAASSTPQTIVSAKRLAELMAGKARMLQRAAEAYLNPVAKAYEAAPAGTKPPPLLDMMLNFRQVLMPDVGPEEFSDIFAQTLTYGMFAARLNDPTPATFSRFEAMKLIPDTNPFLKHLFQYVATNLEPELEWIVDDLAEMFKSVDAAKVMRGYGKATGMSDPIVHFYEDFLREYDAGLRKDRGVWYTPIQVVRFIVSAVDWALQSRFGLPDGLADSSKTEIEVDEELSHGKRLSHKIKKTVHRVQVLDPATGTGTFLAEAVRQIFAKFSGNAGAWPGYAVADLLPRLNGFELLMASYTMAHIKLGLTLNATGVSSTGKERFRIFLTDSLSDWHDTLPGGLFAIALAAEQQGADEVKRDTPVMVVMGNPPYSGESQNKGKWIMNLMEDYKLEPGGKMKLQERNPKWLNDDYVKFIRLAEHYVEKNGSGIVAYITSHGFLDNPTFRGMRWRLMQAFDEMYFLNLHGNSKKKEVAPDGSKDECVFSIQQGVAISLFIKHDCSGKKTPCKVYYSDLWGKKRDKLDTLATATMSGIKWQKLTPVAPMHFFVPMNMTGEAEYNKGFRIDELMPINSMGITTGDDAILIGSDYLELVTKVSTKYNESDNKKVMHIAYRPFDNKLIYYDKKLLARAREKVMSKIGAAGLSIVLIRINSKNNGCPVLVSEGLVDKTILSSKDNANVFPLWLYEEDIGREKKRANMDAEIVTKIEAAIGGATSPEDIFAYIYGVLYSPQYRQKYKVFLKSDFPRIPYPKDAAQFKAVVKIGRSLIETHLMRGAAPGLSETRGRFPKMGSNEVEKVAWEDTVKGFGRVHINSDQFFDNVPKEAWEMPIGGYCPAEKWLKDRRGRVLSSDDIKHYQRIVLALGKTAELAENLPPVTD